jgi:type 1 glutamine amidotransferase
MKLNTAKVAALIGATAAFSAAGLFFTGALRGQAAAQEEKMTMPPNRMAHVLVVSQTKGFEHDSIPDAMANIWRMGHDTRLWETTLRTDTENITKTKKEGNFKSLDYFDVLIFASTTGELDLTDAQKHDMMSFIKDDGKGFVGIHAALDTNYKWPEYGEMIGAWFDQHPWFTFNAPIINEGGDFPATRHFPHAFTKRDEIYQPSKEFSRAKVNVLLSLDASKLDYSNNPRIHRADRDFAVAWSKMYGKGRVFYSTLGHTKEAWDDPDIQKMYFEAIKWTLHLTEGSTDSHPQMTESGTK